METVDGSAGEDEDLELQQATEALRSEASGQVVVAECEVHHCTRRAAGDAIPPAHGRSGEPPVVAEPAADAAGGDCKAGQGLALRLLAAA